MGRLSSHHNVESTAVWRVSMSAVPSIQDKPSLVVSVAGAGRAVTAMPVSTGMSHQSYEEGVNSVASPGKPWQPGAE